MRNASILTAALCLVGATVMAADKKPLSPPAKAEAKIGGKNVSVSYSAPSKRDRVIMGGLVPYGEVWRTGANAATTLTTETDLMIGDLHVPAGKYTLFTIPGQKEWTLIVNRQTGQWGTNYDESQDLGRVKMKVTPVKDTVETFNIGVQDGALVLAWENTQASAPLKVR